MIFGVAYFASFLDILYQNTDFGKQEDFNQIKKLLWAIEHYWGSITTFPRDHFAL